MTENYLFIQCIKIRLTILCDELQLIIFYTKKTQ